MPDKAFPHIILLTFLLTTLPAQAYIGEAGISYRLSTGFATLEREASTELSYFTQEFEQETDTSDARVRLQFLFRDVALDTSRPWQEAAFLNKAGHASIHYSTREIEARQEMTFTSDGNYWPEEKSKIEPETLGTALRIIIGPVILEPGYHSANSETPTGSKNDSRDTRLGIGGYLGDSQELVFTAADIKNTTKSVTGFKSRTEISEYALRYKGVFAAGRSLHIAPAVMVSHTKESHEDLDLGSSLSLEAAVMLYPLHNLGIGPRIRITTTEYDLSASHFFYSKSQESTLEHTDVMVNVSYMPSEAVVLELGLLLFSEYGEAELAGNEGEYYYEVTEELIGAGLGLNTGVSFRF